MAMLVSSDSEGRVQLPPGYRNRNFGLYRDTNGTIHLTPLPIVPDEDLTTISSDPTFP